MDRAVELPVTAAVQPVAVSGARAGGDRGCAGVSGEARFAAESLCAGGVADDHRGGDGARSRARPAVRGVRFDQRVELGAQLALLTVICPIRLIRFATATCRGAPRAAVPKPAGDPFAPRAGGRGFAAGPSWPRARARAAPDASAAGYRGGCVRSRAGRGSRSASGSPCACSSRCATGSFSEPSVSAARATAVASIGSDFPAARARPAGVARQPRRDPEHAVTAREQPTLQPPDTCRQSSTAHTRSSSSSRRTATPPDAPSSVAWIVTARASRRLPRRARPACAIRLCVSTPITIIYTVPSLEMSRRSGSPADTPQSGRLPRSLSVHEFPPQPARSGC